MSEKPVISLFIPHLLMPLTLWHKDFSYVPECGHLEQLFKQLVIHNTKKVHGLSACFLASLGGKNGEVPIAKGRITTANTYKKLICADPVYLEIGMNDITLSKVIANCSFNDAKEIIDLLNQHFKEDGLHFLMEQESVDTFFWYIEVEEEHDFQSIPLENAMRQNIQGKLPKSKNKNWQALQNEVQMLLHNCEVNQQREIAGLTPINSLWFWGGGNLQNLTSPYTQLLSQKFLDNQTTGKTYAKVGGCDWKELPDNLNNRLNSFNQNTCIILDQLFMPAIHDDVKMYQKLLEELDQNYIEPLLQAWTKNQIEIEIHSCDGLILKPKRTKSWAFWQKPTSLLEISQRYH